MSAWSIFRREKKKESPQPRERNLIEWHGPFFLNHSLAHVNRELALALVQSRGFAADFDLSIKQVGTATFGVEADERFRALQERMEIAQGRPRLTIRHSWPPDFSIPEKGKLAVILPWEYGSIPRPWKSAINQLVDEVWTPTTFVRNGYIDDGVSPEKVFVVPNGINPDRFNVGVAPYDLASDPLTAHLHPDCFKFLFLGGGLWRKGLDILLDAFSRAFSAADNVALIVKDFGGTSFYAGQTYADQIRELQGKAQCAPIVHLTREFSDDQIASLYAACDCLAHPYRGEGYGLPIAEAMACGKGTIVTGFGAALDFADETNSFLIPATVARREEKTVGEFETVNFPYVAEPDLDALISLLRFAATHRDEVALKGKKAAEDMTAKHTWALQAEIALARMNALAG